MIIDTMIGKYCQVRDNSQAFKVKDRSVNPMLALTYKDDRKDRPICLIVSEPYNLSYINVVGDNSVNEFITVSYDGELCVVMTFLDLVIL